MEIVFENSISQVLKIENENGLEKQQIIELFDYSDYANNSELETMYQCKLVEIQLEMLDGTDLKLLYNDSVQFIDISYDIGLGNFLISPSKNIKSMQVEFRIKG